MTPELLKERMSGIGGSDIGVILGLSTHATQLDVYLAKRGEDRPGKNEQAMYWGSVLEDVVAREYQLRTGRRIQRINQMLRHPAHEFAIANVDRAIVSPEIAGNVRWKGGRLTTDRILECKTANAFAADQWGPAGSDYVPESYLAQCQWYLGVTGASVADLAVLIGGSDYRIYSLARDDGLIADMIEMAANFWRRVQDGTAPDPQSVADAARKWPRHLAGKSLVVDVTIADACAELRTIAEQKKQIEAMEDVLKVQIMSAFGDAEEITHGGERLATWKNQSANRMDVARLKLELPDVAARFTTSSENRVFRLAKSKE